MAASPSDGGFVVITGSSTGIGAATALHLADRGFHVFAGVRRRQDGEALAANSKG
jgi:NAD(P)-dependent dehydrogenase (short-subunit alcohol dehydrogenase family)